MIYVPAPVIIPHTSHKTHTTVNKTIVYSDTVLPLKDLGDNLKVTSIKDISEDSLEKCLEIIFQSNPNVTFNTIQYSKNNKKLYLYTDKEITTKDYEESKFNKYKPITSRTEILEEAKRILLSKKNKDDNCISLYDVSKLLKKLNRDYDSVIERYKDNFNDIIKSRFGNDIYLIISAFDYKNNILKIRFSNYGGALKDIYFAKENGDLYIVKSETYHASEILSVLNSNLSSLYDELIKYADYKDYKKASYDIKAVNSNFDINIFWSSINIFVRSQDNYFMKDFDLTSHSNKNEYSLKCNSSIINEFFQGKEEEIFKRIFVKISDCPEWSQTMLYEIRRNQLEEEKRIEKENKYKEMKRQKRLEFARKIFPFLKK